MSFVSLFVSLSALLPYAVCVYIVGSENHLVAKNPRLISVLNCQELFPNCFHTVKKPIICSVC